MSDTIGKYVPTPVGFARVNREPLDKYEIFNSIKELKEYVANGPVYVGQICKVKLYSNLVLEYMVEMYNNKYFIKPLYPTPFEECIKTYKDITGSDPSTQSTYENSINTNCKWLMIYYCDGTTDKKLFSTASSLTGFSLEYKFLSLLDNLELYRDDDGNFKFLYYETNSSSSTTHTVYTWSQPNNFYLGERVDTSKFTSGKYYINMTPNTDSTHWYSLKGYTPSGSSTNIAGIYPKTNYYTGFTALFVAIPHKEVI